MQRIAPLIPLRNLNGNDGSRIDATHPQKHIRLNARENIREPYSPRHHQQATGGTAIGHRASRRRQTGTLQRTHGINENPQTNASY